MHALVDDQRAMDMAEQYSDRRIMVRTREERSQIEVCLRIASRLRHSPSICDQTSCETTLELGCCQASRSNGIFLGDSPSPRSICSLARRCLLSCVETSFGRTGKHPHVPRIRQGRCLLQHEDHHSILVLLETIHQRLSTRTGN